MDHIRDHVYAEYVNGGWHEAPHASSLERSGYYRIIPTTLWSRYRAVMDELAECPTLGPKAEPSEAQGGAA